MPSNEDLASNACDRLLANLSSEETKGSFSELLTALHDQIYEDYKTAEKSVGEEVLASSFGPGSLDFNRLDRFFLSLGQSRKSRGGKVFEIILEELLAKRLGFPLDSQVTIEGAKPDFVMPSGAHFEEHPLDCILLTAKRTLRERWRQVVTEANKTYSYFLATLDDQISESQLTQAQNHKIWVVTTLANKTSIRHYNSAKNVLSFEQFISNHLEPSVDRWSKA